VVVCLGGAPNFGPGAALPHSAPPTAEALSYSGWQRRARSFFARLARRFLALGAVVDLFSALASGGGGAAAQRLLLAQALAPLAQGCGGVAVLLQGGFGALAASLPRLQCAGVRAGPCRLEVPSS
jgi:hypothetical protein